MNINVLLWGLGAGVTIEALIFCIIHFFAGFKRRARLKEEIAKRLLGIEDDPLTTFLKENGGASIIKSEIERNDLIQFIIDEIKKQKGKKHVSKNSK